ncbi:hypothetical protein G9A89_000429 [Geosiphon pyriformis]|nr:hypothetical protein G9A89_000429 [Geosiphon pyriformis]
MPILINQSIVTTRDISNSEPLSKSRLLSTTLHPSSTAINLPNPNLLNLSTSYLPTTAASNISTLTNSNSVTKFNSDVIQKPKTENCSTKLEISDGCLSTNSQFIKSTIRVVPVEFRNWPLTSNILPAASTENELLATIFSFKLEKTTTVPLFSGAILDTKPITAMYTNAKVDGQSIKLILDSGLVGSIITQQFMNQLNCQVDCATSARIITTNRAIRTPIDKIDDFSFEVNNITILIKLQLNFDGQHTHISATCEVYQVLWANNNHNELPLILTWDEKRKDKEEDKLKETMATKKIMSKWDNELCLTCDKQLLDKRITHSRGTRATCDLIYNLPSYIIYKILEEEKSINNCTSESKSSFKLDSNSDNNNNKNNDFSSIQNNNNNNNNLNSNSNPEQYIALPNFSKKQELKWFSDNNEGIMPKHAHNTDVEFDLRYPGKEAIKLKPYLHTCIDFKVALKISTTTIVQLVSRSKNIIAMLQNDSKKAYIIAKQKNSRGNIPLVLVRNREKLGITARRINGFKFMNRVDVPVNMAKEKIIDKGEIIFTCQPISIPPYGQYIVVVEKKGMLSAPTRTIRTDKLGKLRFTLTYAAQDITQQL